MVFAVMLPTHQDGLSMFLDVPIKTLKI